VSDYKLPTYWII